MIILKQTQKAKIRQLIEQFNKAKLKNIWNLFDVYERPSQQKIKIFDNIASICNHELNSNLWYISRYNTYIFSMICKYTGKNGETRLRYWGPYNIYDCEVL